MELNVGSFGVLYEPAANDHRFNIPGGVWATLPLSDLTSLTNYLDHLAHYFHRTQHPAPSTQKPPEL